MLCTYRDDFLFQNIVHSTEEKFKKYFKDFSIIFYFATIMVPRIKFERSKYLLENFYEKMNYLDSFLAWNDIEHSINNIYNFYDSQFENKYPNLLLHLGLKVLIIWFIICIQKIKKVRLV